MLINRVRYGIYFPSLGEENIYTKNLNEEIISYCTMF